jgi:hypothetical protein
MRCAVLDQDRIVSLMEDLDERQAIIDAEHGSETHRPHRTFTEIYTLEDIANESMKRSERFPGEHEVASAMLAKDVPRWRKLARGVASGLGVSA